MCIYFALGIIALCFPVIIVSNSTYVAPAGRDSEFPRTRVATWRSLLQKTQFLTARSIAIHHMALRWSAEIGRITILLTLHSSGVKPFYEGMLFQNLS